MVCNAGVVFLLVLASASIGVNAQSKPTVSFDRARVSVIEGTFYCFELQVVGFFNEPFSVDVRLVPASAEHFLDFALSAVPADLVATVTFTVGFINSTEVCITMVDNPAWEPVEYFLIIIFIRGGVNATALLGSPSTLRVNILDDDEVRVSFQSSSVVVNEGAGQLDLELTSIGIYTTPFSVTVRCLQVFPVEARLSDVEHDHVDAYPVVFTAHFDQLDQADTLSSRFSISIVDDFVTEPPEQFICLILRPFGTSGIVVADPDTITILIEDNDELFVSFTERFPIGTEGDTVTINLVASGPFVEPFRTRIFSSSLPKRHRSKLCEASEAVDYRSPSSAASNMGVVDFNYNTLNTISSALTIPIIEDNVFECTEECFRLNFVFELEDDGDDFQLELKVGTPETALVCIPDPDKMFVRFEKPSYTVGEKDGDVSIRLEALQEDPDNPGSYKPADYTVDLEIPCSTMDGSAKAVSDYTSQAGSVAFKAGNEFSSDFTVLITDDTVSECPEDFTVVCSIPQEWEGRIFFVDGVDTAGVMVESDDQSRISFTVNMVESTEGVNPSFQLMVQADNDFQEDQRVRITASDGSAIDALDYTLETTVTSLSAGSTMFDPPITVNVVNNDVSECPESFTVSLILRNNIMNCGGVLGNNSQVTASILDDDDASISFTISSRSVDEDAGSFELTVESDNTFQEDQTVTIMTMDGTALTSSDFDLNTDMVTLSAGSTTFAPPIMVSLVNNGISECPEMFKVCLSLPDDIATCKGIEGSNVCVDVTINDEDDASISFTISSRSVDEDAGSFELTVESDNTFQEDQTVTIMTMDGTALASSDFDLNTTMVTLSAGSTTFAPPIMVSLVDNGISECPEMFKVCLSLPDDITTCKGIEGSNVCVDVTINDEDDASISFTISSRSVDEDAGSFELTVESDNTFQEDQTVTIMTMDGTALASSDFDLNTDMVTLSAGSTTFVPPIMVSLVNNGISECPEMFKVCLSLPDDIATCKGIEGSNVCVDVTINDEDDASISFTISSRSVDEDAGSFELTVESDNTFQEDQTVTIMTMDGTALTPSDFDLNTDMVTLSAGSTTFVPPIIVSLVNNGISECPEMFKVCLSLPDDITTCKGIEGSNVCVDVTINDEDESKCGFTVPSMEVMEGRDPFYELSVRCDNPFQDDQVIVITATDGTAKTPIDYVLQTKMSMLTAGMNMFSPLIRTDITNDDVVEDVEMQSVNLVLPNRIRGCGAVPGDNQEVDVTILDDDSVFIRIVNQSFEVSEDGISISFQLEVANGTVFFPFNVNVVPKETTPVSATENEDFTATGGSTVVSFNPGETVSSTATTIIIDDDASDCDETFQLQIVLSLGPGQQRVVILEPSNIPVTIRENDENPLSFNTSSLRETEGPSLPIISTHVDARIPFQRDTVFTIVCTDGTANNVSDYELLTPTVTFSANSRKSSDVRVRILDDDIVEDVEMFQCVIELSQLQTECGVTLDDATLDVTIDDDDIVFLGLNLDLIPKEIVEGQGPAIVQLIVSNGTVFFHIDVLVSVREISSGNTVSAQEFLDFYVFGDENTAKLERFQNVSSIAEIRTVNNLLCEPPEMFEIVVTVSHPRVFILPPTIVNLTIIDDDINDPDFECFPPAVVTFKSDSFYLVERGSTYTRPVFRIGRMEQPLTIGVTTEELTATEGTDYTLQTTSITFSDIGAEFERVDVRFTVPLGDGEEPREAFRIDLQVPNDAGTLTRQLDVTVIITDKS